MPSEAIQCKPLEVVVSDRGIERAIKMLKRKLASEGVLRELKMRRHYMKPSVKRRRSRRSRSPSSQAREGRGDCQDGVKRPPALAGEDPASAASGRLLRRSGSLNGFVESKHAIVEGASHDAGRDSAPRKNAKVL